MNNLDNTSLTPGTEGYRVKWLACGQRLMRPCRGNRTGALISLLLGSLMLNPVLASETGEELVSFRCALAIDSVLTKLDEQPQNLVIQDALSEIDDYNGQFVCISINANELQVRLQSTEMSNADNRLVFVLDASTYSIRKTFFGR